MRRWRETLVQDVRFGLRHALEHFLAEAVALIERCILRGRQRHADEEHALGIDPGIGARRRQERPRRELACYLPARRAAGVDPIVALRQE